MQTKTPIQAPDVLNADISAIPNLGHDDGEAAATRSVDRLTRRLAGRRRRPPYYSRRRRGRKTGSGRRGNDDEVMRAVGVPGKMYLV